MRHSLLYIIAIALRPARLIELRTIQTSRGMNIMYTMNVVGAGKLGQQIALSLSQSKLVELKAICNQRAQSAKDAIQQLGSGQAVDTIAELPAADIYWLAVPDETIAKVANELAMNNQLPMNSLIIHSSGLLTASVMNTTKIKQCQLASLHPMKSFATLDPSEQALHGIFCALEGEADATSRIRDWLAPLRLRWLNIKSENKAAYHSAGVFASNYLISIAHAAVENLGRAGIESAGAIDVVTDLMQGTLDNIKQSKCLRTSLTGPVQRGDLNTIEQHLEQMNQNDQRQLYANLGRNIIELTHHNEDFKSQINALLLGYS